MATSRMRVKVPVTHLIAAVEAERAAIVKAHAKAEAAYDKQLNAWRQKVTVYIGKVSREWLDNEKLPRGRYGDVDWRWPERPHKPTLNVHSLDKDLALLKATSDEVLSIGTDDNWAKYL